MKKLILHLITVTALMFAFSGSLFAQSGTIEGYVKQGLSGSEEPLENISVRILLYEMETLTDAEGHYSFPPVVAGDAISVSVVSAEIDASRNIVVLAGSNRVDFWLKAAQDADGNFYSAVEIGTQVWMGENLKTTTFEGGTPIPNVTSDESWAGLSTGAYCWYLNDHMYGVGYGGLYNWYSVNTGLLCPTGWHVPTNTEYSTLIDYVGGIEGGGGKLREVGITRWQDPNDGATNETDFTAVGGGDREINGTFNFIRGNGFWWSSTIGFSETVAWIVGLSPFTNGISNYDANLKYGFSVRCIKDISLPTVTTNTITGTNPVSAICGGNVTSDGGANVTERGICWSKSENPTTSDSKKIVAYGTGTFTGNLTNLDPNTIYYARAYAINIAGTAYGDQESFTTSSEFGPILTNPDLIYGTVTDIESNSYQTVQIGTQLWMAENLKTTKFNDGTNITLVTDNTSWLDLTTEGYCWYKNEETIYRNTFGALYNWFAVNTGKLCPDEWHMPSDAEWTTLATSLGGGDIAGGKLKEIGTTHWTDPNIGASNESGFTALPGGFRTYDGIPFGIGVYSYWWSSTEYDATNAWSRTLFSLAMDFNKSGGGDDKNNGYSVRCVKDILLPTVSTTPISNITAISALSGGDVTSDGGAAIIERGICWSITENPTIADNKSWASAGTGSYTCNLANLDPNILYYVRAFARNSVGTAYGNQEYFTTSAELSLISFPDLTYGTVSDIDGNNYRTIQIGSQVWMAENLKTTKYNDNTSISIAINDNEWYTLTTPAYCWYKNDAGNYKAIYGALYNWYVIDAANNGGKNVCPVGWHIPSNAEWTTLTDYLGGTIVAGGKLKEVGTSHWWTPNEGATNETGFTAIPGGGRIKDGDFYGHFGHIGEIGYWWSRETGVSDRMLRYNDGEVDLFSAFPKQCGFSIRCVKAVELPVVTTTPISSISINTAQSGGNVTSDGGAPVTARGICWDNSSGPTILNNVLPDEGTGTGTFISQINDLVPGTIYYVRAYATNSVGTAYGEEMVFTTFRSDAITDIEGNYYNVVTIGSQVWMAENLKTSKYTDGTSIPNVSSQTDWAALTTPGYCWYNNDEATYKNTFGALYNWHAVNTYKLCPAGWHVPTEDDYATLAALLGDINYAGGKLKETGTDHWSGLNTEATNEFGFTALPGGYRHSNGFYGSNDFGYFWLSSTKIFIESLSTQEESNSAWSYHMYYGNSYLGKSGFQKANGASVRCIEGGLNLALSTTDATSITQNSANTGGNIVYDGGSPVTARGVCWSINPDPTIDDNQIDGGNGTAFTASITGLTANTPYYVRAYAANGYGTFYGDEISFTTYKTNAITDIEGNFYNTVEIGSQVWMAENLKTTKYRNGDAIETIDASTLPGQNIPEPNFQWAYAENEGNVRTYGRLYTWYAVNDNRGVCPSGWHLPTDAEWTTLSDFLGGESIAGGKLREKSTAHWISPNTGATDDYGFTALPGGMMTLPDGPFDVLHYEGDWWTSSENTESQVIAFYRSIGGGPALHRGYVTKAYGFSVRCIQNNSDQTTVRNTNDAGEGSLRNAIEYANSTAGIKDNITFNIPGTGPFTIQPQEALPEITDPVIIDGYTQPGTSSATSKLLIELDGTFAGEGSDGLRIKADNCTIKGLAINRFSGVGIYVESYSKGNIIIGNFIGTDIEGKTDQGNNSSGIYLDITSEENIIGGLSSNERNIISGNNGDGIFLNESKGNKIIGNFIGVDISGQSSLGNNGAGIEIAETGGNIIGGTTTGERNVISSNGEDGIAINYGASGNKINGNHIGADVSGKLPLGNTGDGVFIYYGSNNVIGGVGPGEGNVISFNQGTGISIHTGSNNLITKNSIYNNSKLGIDLEGGTEDDYGVTENGTLNVGPNNLQHYPVLQSITFDRDEVIIAGSLTGANNTVYNLQFFVNKLADESGYGEGQVYLGSATVETDDYGNASFSETFARSTSAEIFTATATDADGNTSEFSKGIGGLESQILAENRFSFSVNELGVPNVLDNSDIDAVVASFQTWSDVETAIIDFTPDEGTTTPEKYAGNDDINLVTFADDLYDIPTGVLAIAAKTWHVDESTNTTQIIDVDIVFNPEFVKDPTYNLGVEGGTYDGYFDIQSVTTHEIGHVLGLLHSGIFNSTMWFQIGEGTNVRYLEQDDKSWASYRYPTETYNSTFGSISGKITYGYDNQPVAGAFVQAILVGTTDTIHSYSDADGNYLVPGLIPGSYNIFIEPLDGDVNGEELWPGNISEYIGSNTIYLDYPDEYYSSDESADEVNDTPVPIVVSAGSTSGPCNIVSNKDNIHPTVELVKPTLTSGDLVNVLSNFNIRFSEPVDMTTFTGTTCYLSSEGTTETVTGSVTKPYSEYPSTVLFDPATDLKHNETYTLHLTTGIMDMRENNLENEYTQEFNTVPLDETAPSINEVIPADDSINVFISSSVKLIFSEPMNMSSVEDGFALTWTEEGTTNTVEGSFSWQDYNKLVIFTPSGYLKEGTVYTISVSAAAMDLSANTMESSRSFTFTTVAEAPPEILYVGPSGEDITINTPVVVDFSEPINTSSVNSTTFKLLSGLNPSSDAEPIVGTYEFFNENSTVVFRPLADLTEFTDYTIILTDGITDVSQPSSSLANSKTTFKTADKVSEPSISYLDLTYGVAGNAVTIAGAGFDPNPALNTVRFNGTQAVITKAYLTSLEVVVPAEALSGPVTVTVNNITSNSKNFDIYTEILDPAGYATANAPIGKKSTHDSDVTPEGAFAYVTNPEEGTVSVVDMNTLDVETIMIGEGKYPLMIDINPEGTKAYVTNFYSSDVSVIDLEPGVNYNTVIKNISVGIGPWGVAVTPDGQRVYVANYYSGSLSMIDADPTSGGYDHATANIPIGKDPTVTKANPDGALVLVVGDFGLTIVNSDPSNKDEYNTAAVNITIGKKFTAATSTPDGAFAIVSTDDGYLLLIDLYPENGDYSDVVLANVKIGTDPSDIKARGDNAYVYLTDTDGDRILVYKIGVGGTGGAGSSMPSGIGMTLVYETEIPVGDAPQSLAIDADRLYVVDGDPSEPEVRRVTVFQFGLLSLSNGFSDLTKAIQGMIDAGYIKPANGKNIIRKLEDAQKYLDAGKTKNALNSLNAAGNMIKALMNSRQITADQGNYLLNLLNLIIAEIDNSKKSGEIDYYNVDLEQPVSDLIAETRLGIIYPNPTKEAITINYEIAENELGSEKVTIQIYDVIGRLVSNLVNENLAPGRYSATWNGNYDNGELASLGYYFIRFSAGNVREVKQIMMIR